MISSTTKWLSKQHKWLQVAAKRLLEVGTLKDDVISELNLLCKQEAKDEFPEIDYCIPVNPFGQNDADILRLCSISNIVGVNKLAPKKPLDFWKENIVVVYGNNGSGKSSYVRLLKHICGARTPGLLHHNVFNIERTAQQAKITFEKNNNSTTYDWTSQNICEDLGCIDFFDTSFGGIFMNDGDEVSYEPPVLSFFSSLIEVCERVSEKLDNEAGRFQSKKPILPSELSTSIEAVWFGNINARTPEEEIENYCSFTDKDEKEIQSLQKRLSEQAPKDKAIHLQKKKTHANSIIQDSQRYLDQLSVENCKNIISANKKSILKKLAAKAAAEHVFEGIELNGIGSDVWKELWAAARKYSSEAAYKDQEFPVVKNDSLCVLCHQPLSEEAKQRLLSFEAYVKGETQTEADKAAKDVKTTISAIEDIPTSESLKTKLDAAGIEKQDLVIALTETFTSLQNRKQILPTLESEGCIKINSTTTIMAG